jgi:hypothetical protein
VRYQTYADIAKAIEVDYCGEEGSGHDTGYCSMDGAPNGRTARVHWTERRVTRSGIRRFLMLAYDAEPVSYVNRGEPIPSWLNLWWKIKWVRETARDVLHTTIPTDLWAEDKARLAAKLTNAPYSVHDYEEREAALRWARR